MAASLERRRPDPDAHAKPAGRTVDVRRLAAIDMHGWRGTRLRRTLIVTEFVAGAVGGTAIGVLVIADAGGLGWRLFGLWLVGISLNYVPLALHALSLLPPGRLTAELAGVDIPAELRHYTTAQLRVVVPLLFVLLALVQLRPSSSRP